MSRHSANVYVDYQQRAKEFSIGDLVAPVAAGAAGPAQTGTVIAVWPGIGQLDVEFPWGSGRYPVEEMQRVTNTLVKPVDIDHTTIPGGAGSSAGVSGGPEDKTAMRKHVDRVAHAWLKHALYWADKNRHYRGTKVECEDGKYICPRCRIGEDGEPVYLRPTNYKREGGLNHRLLGCHLCLFLIKPRDIIGHPDYVEDVEVDAHVATWDGKMDSGSDSVRKVRSASPNSHNRRVPVLLKSYRNRT